MLANYGVVDYMQKLARREAKRSVGVPRWGLLLNLQGKKPSEVAPEGTFVQLARREAKRSVGAP